MANLLEQIQVIQTVLDKVKEDAEKFTNGNKAAGTRVRTGSMDIIKGLKDVRNTVTSMKNQS